MQGHAAQIADELCDAALDHPEHAPELLREAAHFLQNKRRMSYLEVLEQE